MAISSSGATAESYPQRPPLTRQNELLQHFCKQVKEEQRIFILQNIFFINFHEYFHLIQKHIKTHHFFSI